ncbi:MAG: tetratricopeptide repeat protein [Armatimonadota bacterium]|nr:tetratricopeptide repeat protein [Armatimonadota bacterium]
MKARIQLVLCIIGGLGLAQCAQASPEEGHDFLHNAMPYIEMVASTIGIGTFIAGGLAFFNRRKSKERELFSLFREAARDVISLSPKKAASAFSSESLQKQILNSVHGIEGEWDALREAFLRQGAPKDKLESSGPFYRKLAALMELSEHWRDSGKALAHRLQTPPAPAVSAPPVPAAASQIPSGTVTFLFTDIQDSTSFWDRLGSRFQPVKEEHDKLMRRIAAQYDGHEANTTGDGFFYLFQTASQGIECAIAMQVALATDAALQSKIAPLKDVVGDALKARIGLHAGELMPGASANPEGPNSNVAARVMGAGHGGQILVSREAFLNARTNLPAEITCADLGKYHLKGISEDVELYQVHSPALPRTQFPPLTAPSPERVHLPKNLPPFIGREDDVRKTRELLLEPQTRVVTLVGPGGVGKTRLSIRVAEEVANQFADGVWFLELESVTEPSGIYTRIVDRLSLAAGAPATESDEDRVLKFLANKTLLLVLDNLEQIEGAAGPIRRIVEAAKGVKCLGSSRERLAAPGWPVLAVSPLAVPSGDDPQALLSVESARFFVERARWHQPDFEVTTNNAPSIAALCRQLEGVPLALELAAAWAPLMEPGEILSDIQKHLNLLGSEHGAAPERQRTVRASIEWSFSRLAPTEQTVFARLGAFAGGWTREAALAVCAEPNVVAVLRTLLEKSLIRRTSTVTGTRFGLLNTTRLYAAEKLAADADAGAVHARYMDYFSHLAQDCVSHLRTADEAAAFSRLEADLENAQSALDWAQETGRDEEAAHIALALGIFLGRRGSQREALAVVDVGMDAARRASGEHTALFAHLLREQVNLTLDQFRYAEARQGARRLLALCESLGLPKGIGHAHNLLGIAARSAQDYPDAYAQFTEALTRFQESGDDKATATALNNLGVTASEDPNGDKTQAERWYNDALTRQKALGDRRGIAEALTNLGCLAEDREQWDAARQFHTETLALEQSLGSKFGAGRALSNWGEIADKSGDLQAAYRLYAAGQHLFAQVGSPFQDYTGGLFRNLAERLGRSQAEQESLLLSLKDRSLDDVIAWASAKPPAA